MRCGPNVRRRIDRSGEVYSERPVRPLQHSGERPDHGDVVASYAPPRDLQRCDGWTQYIS